MPRNVEYLQDWCRRNQFPAPLSLSAAAAPYPPSIEPLALLLTDLERAYLDLKAAIKTACEKSLKFQSVVVLRSKPYAILTTLCASRSTTPSQSMNGFSVESLRDIARLTKGE